MGTRQGLMDSKTIRTGCLKWFVGFALLSSFILIPVNLIEFFSGAGAGVPLWFKIANISMLLGQTISMVIFWQGKQSGMFGYLITTLAYWVANMLYRGFRIESLALFLAISALFLVLVYRDRRSVSPQIATSGESKPPL
jgi:hypothetical protein